MDTFTYSVNNLKPAKSSYEQVKHGIIKWLERGHPSEIANLQIFHLGRLHKFDNVEELIQFIWLHRESIDFCTIASVDKNLRGE